MRKLLIFTFAACAFGAGPADYIPLQADNQWIYRPSGGGSTVTSTVGRTAQFGGQTYIAYSGFDGALWLRTDASGAILMYDPDTKSERSFMTADGVASPANSCRQTGRVTSTTADYSGPIGTFTGSVVLVRYDAGACADAGIAEERYLPYVGLLQRTVTTIAGPRTYDLVYARVGGVLVATAPETSFTLALDAASYTAGSEPLARIALRHTGPNPLVYDQASGQEFDVTVFDSQGNLVYRWSDGKAFPQMVVTVQLNGERNWSVALPLAKLGAGNYTAEATLATTPAGVFKASLPFTIVAK